MSCFSSTFMPAIGSSSSRSSRLGGERAGELDALLQAVGQPPDRRLADVLDLEEVDDLLDLAPVLELLALRRADPQRLLEEVACCIFRLRPVMMLSSTLMPLKRAMFWKVRAMPIAAASWLSMSARVSPL